MNGSASREIRQAIADSKDLSDDTESSRSKRPSRNSTRSTTSSWSTMTRRRLIARSLRTSNAPHLQSHAVRWPIPEHSTSAASRSRNIRKITRTMELIATARFKKAMDRASAATAYTQRITQLVDDLTQDRPGGQPSAAGSARRE